MNEMAVNIFSGSGAGTSVQSLQSAATQMAVSRQAQEVQAAMVVAKRFPRDNVQAFNRILQACSRRTLAEKAMYEYPRGGEKVTGPSIRLAEAVAQAWGNIDFGIIELEQRVGESQVMAYAWDLETNSRQTKIFSVPHARYTKKGGLTPLTDPRDIYEMVANQGARRLRACILGVIPGDVIDAAVSACAQTLAGVNKEPLIDRVRKMTRMFQEDFGVPLASIEKVCGCNADAFSEQDMIRLGKIYNSLRDGMAKREDYFDLSAEGKEEDVPATKNRRGARSAPGQAAPEAEKNGHPATVSLDDL